MRQFLFIVIFVYSSLIKGQPTCSTISTGGDTFYPNSITTPTFATTGAQYLCGPNTIVYDTISIGCLAVHVNSGSTLFYNKGCPQMNVNVIWLKNNSTLNILPNCPPMSLTVYYEPLAIINNLAAISIGSVACSSIPFPSINCSNGVNDLSNPTPIFSTYPNPSYSQINIEALNFNDKIIQVSIFNHLGKLVHERNDWNAAEKEINIENLAGGLYFIQVKTSRGQQTQKIVINR